jgi:hypothetical protein
MRARVRPQRRSGRALATAAVPDLALVRERTRGWIAFAVIGPPALVSLAAVVGLLIGRVSVTDLKELFASLGLNTLVGTAMGFYFGRVTK